MPRPSRILRTTTIACSLALFTLAAAFWIRSQFAIDRWVWGTPPRAYHIRSQVGYVDFEYANIPPPNRAAYGAYHVPITRRFRSALAHDRPRAAEYRSDHLQLPAAGPRPAINVDTHLLRLRYWLICLLTAIAPTAQAITQLHHRHQQRQRASPTLCPTCHYDLRATPDRCPECGMLQTPTPTPS